MLYVSLCCSMLSEFYAKMYNVPDVTLARRRSAPVDHVSRKLMYLLSN